MTRRICSCVVLVCAIGLSAAAQKVNVDWQRGSDFSKYKTYAWGASPHPVEDALWNQRIVGFIDGQLVAKGLRKVAPDQNPNLVVVYNAGVKQDVSLEGYRTGVFMASGSIQRVVENDATLVVDLADPQQKMVVWRGTAEQTLADKSDKNIERVQKMVTKMFKHYPPKAK